MNMQRRRQRYKPNALKNEEGANKGVKNKPGREGDKTKMPGDNFWTAAMTDVEGVG